MGSLSHTWGTTPQERVLAYPCDGLIDRPDCALYRGVTVRAEPAVVFRWLCQMRVAPYSYDWIDNFGRRSPRRLTPGLDDLAVGQEVMRIFDLADFERDRHLTIRVKQNDLAYRVFGDVAASYCVVGEGCESRLLVKMVVRYPSGMMGRLMRMVLPWGDLIMMRRQLLNLKALAERWDRDPALARSEEEARRRTRGEGRDGRHAAADGGAVADRGGRSGVRPAAAVPRTAADEEQTRKRRGFEGKGEEGRSLEGRRESRMKQRTGSTR